MSSENLNFEKAIPLNTEIPLKQPDKEIETINTVDGLDFSEATIESIWQHSRGILTICLSGRCLADRVGDGSVTKIFKVLMQCSKLSLHQY